MQSKILLPLLILPLLIFVLIGSLSYYWYSKTAQTFAASSAKYSRLQQVSAQLKVLDVLEAQISGLRRKFLECDAPITLDNARLYLSNKAKPEEGVKFEGYNKITAPTFIPAYGAVQLKFTCRSEALSNYFVDAMNNFPNLILSAWDIEINSQNKLLQFNTTVVLAKIK